jgi:hypothetical protein
VTDAHLLTPARRNGMALVTFDGAIAGLAAEGAVEVPIKGRYPLDRVQDAYRQVADRSGLGKVVLDVAAP